MRLLLFAAALLFVTVSGAKAQDQATVVASCGTAHYTAGTQAFRTVNVNGVTCSGAGSGVATSVWSASDAAANGMTLSNGGLTVTPSGVNTWLSVRGSTSKTAGKLYVEFATSATVTSAYVTVMGLASAGFDIGNYIGFSNYSGGIQNTVAFDVSAGFTGNYIAGIAPPQAAANDVFGIAVDFAAGNMWLSRNGVWTNSSNPATGTLPAISFVPATVGALFPGLSFNNPGSGIWTLQPTAASQKYAAPAGFTAWDGGAAPTGCSQATAYLARATGETAHAADLTALICGLVSDGVWSKLDALYLLAQQTQADALLNLAGTSYPLAASGPLTFAAYQGFSGFVVGTNVLNLSGYNPSPNNLLYTQNNASLGVWSYPTVDDNTGQMGSGSGGSGIYASYGGSFYPRVNVPGTPPCCVSPGTNGLFVGDRNNSASLEGYWNGIDKGTVTGTSGIPDAVFFVGCGGSPSICTAKILSEAHIGASLGSAGNLALYNRLRTYMTAVGVP